MSNFKYQKPFLKWVGGKTQIINDIISKFPKEINNYHEPFIGGGSVLFALLSLIKENKIILKGKIYAYDINKKLINVYKHVQQNKDELFLYIEKYVEIYDSINGTIINRNPTNIEEATTSKESYYYWIRKQFNLINEDTIECSALFIVINHICFRGIYREGPNGFNIPYGHYKKTPKVIKKCEIDNINELIKNVEFINCGFDESFEKVLNNDFIYIDPPYAPENSKSFVKYIYNGFNLEDHKRLFNNIKNMNNSIKFVMSNSNVELVIESFKNYKKKEIIARRAINSKNPASVTSELIIYN